MSKPADKSFEIYQRPSALQRKNKKKLHFFDSSDSLAALLDLLFGKMFYTLYMRDAKAKMKKERLKRLVELGYVSQAQANKMWLDYLRLFKRITHATHRTPV